MWCMSYKSRDLHHMTILGFVDAIRKVYKLEKNGEQRFKLLKSYVLNGNIEFNRR